MSLQWCYGDTWGGENDSYLVQNPAVITISCVSDYFVEPVVGATGGGASVKLDNGMRHK
jgi:hypothetical protein